MRDYTCRNHVAPRTKLYVPKKDFPIPLNYTDVQRQTKTGIDVLHDAAIEGSCNVDGIKSHSEPWIAVARFALANTNPPEGEDIDTIKKLKRRKATGPDELPIEAIKELNKENRKLVHHVYENCSRE